MNHPSAYHGAWHSQVQKMLLSHFFTLNIRVCMYIYTYVCIYTHICYCIPFIIYINKSIYNISDYTYLFSPNSILNHFLVSKSATLITSSCTLILKCAPGNLTEVLCYINTITQFPFSPSIASSAFSHWYLLYHKIKFCVYSRSQSLSGLELSLKLCTAFVLC